jgi:hypothetical protein
MFLDMICTLARLGPTAIERLSDGVMDDGRGKRGLLDFIGDLVIDWDVPLRKANNWYDRLVAALNARTKAERNAELEKFDADVKHVAGSAKQVPSLFEAVFTPRKMLSEKVSDVLVALMLPAISAAASAEDRAATKFTLVDLAIALERYRARHGQYPKDLGALAPDLISKIPNDSFADRPLVYQPTEKGYLLYSFGKNGKDDGGRCYDHGAGDDIVVATPDAATRPEK